MVKEKNDYPIVLSTRHVVEILECSETTARQYINHASTVLKQQGKVALIDVVRNARIPRDLFFEIYRI